MARFLPRWAMLIGVGATVSVLVWAQDSVPSVAVSGDVKQPLTLTAEALAKMPRAAVKMTSHGIETAYEGVWLSDILRQAGVPQGAELRGRALATCVLAEAQDGYQVVFSLAELDPSFGGGGVLLADTGNGKPLFGEQGRFRLIAAHDKPEARSIRLLTKLEVLSLRK